MKKDEIYIAGRGREKERGQISTSDETQLTGYGRRRPNVNRQMIRRWNMARPLRIAFPGAFYMDNHYYLLFETPSANLRQIMQHINGTYTTYINVIGTIGVQFGIGDAAVGCGATAVI